MTPPPVTSRAYLSLLVLTAGLCTLGLEMTALSLLAPWFGISQLVWASVIGVTLLYLALGYVVGGRRADRRPALRLLCLLLTVAAAFVAAIPLLSRPILGWSSRATSGDMLGSLAALLVLFSVPTILLAMTGPFAVRLAMRSVDGAGKTAGFLYALSTAGSLLGTFLPTLVLTPLIGTARTITVLAVVLLVVALPGLWRGRRLPVALSLVALGFATLTLCRPPGRIKPAKSGEDFVVYERESFYNYIRVSKVPVARGADVTLALNEGWVTHSVYHTAFEQSHDPDDLLTHAYWDFVSVAPFVHPDKDASTVRSLAMIGLGAGTVPKLFLALYGPTLSVDAVEIDAEIVDVARTWFALDDHRFPSYRVHIGDGRRFLNRAERTWDVIAVDVYRWPYIPFHLITREAFETMRGHLAPGGVVTVKCDRGAIGQNIAATLKSVFPQVFQLSSMLIAVNTPVGDGVANLARNARAVKHPTLRRIMERALETRQTPYPFQEWTGSGQVFTDDLAPVELILHKGLWNKLRGGDWPGS
jgi:spermidine synthase